jgi:hypothetical protein
VVSADDVGPTARALLGPEAGGFERGAAAVLVTSDRASAAVRLEPARLILGEGAPEPPRSAPVGHAALAPLAAPSDDLPLCLSSGARGAFAKIDIVRL